MSANDDRADAEEREHRAERSPLRALCIRGGICEFEPPCSTKDCKKTDGNAIDRVRRYVMMRDAKPLAMLVDPLHAIHAGSIWEAELNLADVRALLIEHDALKLALDTVVDEAKKGARS